MTNEPITQLADLDAERELLGALLVDNGLMERLQVEPNHFSDPTHAALWEAAREIIGRGEAVSVAVLATSFPDHARYIAAMPHQPTMPAQAGNYARTVREFAARRHALSIADKLHERIGDTSAPVDEIVAGAVSELSRVMAGKQGVSKRAVAKEIYEDLGKPLDIYSTGLRELDAVMGGGLIAGRSYTIAARKKTGKTMLLGTISHNLNRDGVRHCFIALEMSAKEIEQRNIARDQRFEHHPSASFDTVRRIVARARLQGACGVFLDGLQLVGGKSPQHTEEYHHRCVAQWFADAARDTGMWMLSSVQTNQQGNTRGGEGPKLACDEYFVLHREKDQYGAWLEMEESRHTIYANVGSESYPGLWLRKHGQHFSDDPPATNEWPSASSQSVEAAT